MYRNIGNVAKHILLPFSATCMYESGFSELVSVKTKARSKLDSKAYIRRALPSAKSRIKLLVSKKQLWRRCGIFSTLPYFVPYKIRGFDFFEGQAVHCEIWFSCCPS